MVKQCLIFLGFFLFAFTPMQTVLKVEDSYVTTEDILSDLVFPTIDERVIKEYGDDPLFDWQWQRIVGINYNDDSLLNGCINTTMRS